MNVRINAAELKDEAFKKEILAKAEKIKNDAIKEEEAILKIVYAVI
jgi:formiminotetrahydrofolate cyclodeaminase